MEADASWQAFACTGNIYRYLDYKQRLTPPAPDETQKEPDGRNRDAGAGAAADTV